MIKTVTIPDTHYIGIQLKNLEMDVDRKTSGMPLGFMTPGGTNAQARKRIQTVKDWTGIGGSSYEHAGPLEWDQFEIDHPDAVLQGDNSESEFFRNKSYLVPNTEGRDYKVLDEAPNEPQFGFRITKSVARYGWNGGNKLVRIEDPRGFELEISVANLVKIMSTTTFIDGVCQEECVWGRDGAANVLLPINSEPYREARETTKVRKTKGISLRDITIGDFVKTKETTYAPGFTGMYMGAYYVYSAGALEKQPDPRYRGGMGDKGWEDRNKMVRRVRRYVLCQFDRENDTKTYHAFSKLEIVKRTAEWPAPNGEACKVPKSIPLDRLTDHSSGNQYSTFAVIPEKIDLVDVANTFAFVEAPEDIVHQLQNPPNHHYLHDTKAFAVDPKDGQIMQRSPQNYGYDRDDEDTLDYFVGYPITITRTKNRWYIDNTGRGENRTGWLCGTKITPENNKNFDVESSDWVVGQFTLSDTVFDLPLYRTY